MKNKASFYFKLTFFMISSLHSVIAQTPDSTLYEIETNDGHILIGIILEQTEDAIQLETATLGLLIIPVADIEEMKAIDSGAIISQGKIWEPRRLGGRYFILPSGYTLKKREWYYQNYFLFFNQIKYGFNDYVTLSVATFPFQRKLPLWLNPQASVPVIKDKFQLSAGAVLGGRLSYGNLDNFGLFYSMVTVGPKDHNISLGLGLAYAQSELKDYPVILLAGQTRIGKKTFLVLDIYGDLNSPNDAGLLLFGGRTAWDNVSLDYGLLLLLIDGPPLIIPSLGVGIPIGKARL